MLNNLRFVDGIVLIRNIIDEIKEIAKELKRCCEMVDLEIDTSKSKVMSKNEGEKFLDVKELELEYVKQYKYLGRMLSFKNKTKKN